ncbi:DUF742 domain-containing protein [Streptomyces boncukensis]|uniref:DUF742 domain-containing protein n=1 Tax=Streptomyces boncukensis TaxID=2711219 RepID=A0A6G4WU41_9ACTN|nr:DUF742 domain-containing protein [Streptomyces boncukensis]NGO68796.1 DUF742 domain-containing protein [Streptomyces boncukensis]
MRQRDRVFDLAAQVAVAPGARTAELGAGEWLGPRHTAVLDACRVSARPVAELAAEAGLTVGTVRALLDDLVTCGCAVVHPPAPPADQVGARVLGEVIDALRAA